MVGVLLQVRLRQDATLVGCAWWRLPQRSRQLLLSTLGIIPFRYDRWTRRHDAQNSTRFLYIPPIILIIVCILAPIGGISNDDPTETAKIMAPLVALSAVTLNLVRDWVARSGTEDKLLKTTVGVGLLFSAYFWFATASGEHPYSMQLITGLGLLVGIVAAVSVLMSISILVVWIASKES